MKKSAVKKATNKNPKEAEEECEWVDDAVLNISAVFSLCHAHDYAQIEFERKIQKTSKAKTRVAVTAPRPSASTSSTECESEGFEATKLAKPKACVMEEDHHRLDTCALGLEVQLQTIQIY